MKKNHLILLFAAISLILLLTACGTPATSTPTAVAPTDFPTDTEVPTMEPMLTETETPMMATATAETTTPTATGPAGVIPVQLVCWFCVQQVPHVIVTLPQSATFTVATSSASIECNSVETVDDKQIVLCQGPKQSGNVSFDLNVCSNGNCSDRHLAAVDCSATTVPTDTATVTATTTGTVTPAGIVITQTPTPGVGATASATSTPVIGIAPTATPTRVALTPTPTP